MAGSTQIHTLRDALTLYADGQYALDELVPFLVEYDFKQIVPGGGFPQEGTVEEIIAFWQAGQIPDDDYEQILDSIAPARQPAS